MMPPAPAGATESVSENGIPGTVPRVFPNDTAFGMAFMVNHSPVFTPPLMALKTDGVPRKLSTDDSRPSVVKGRVGAVKAAALETGAANAWNVPPVESAVKAALSTAAAAAGSVVDVSGVTGVRTPAAVEAAW